MTEEVQVWVAALEVTDARYADLADTLAVEERQRADNLPPVLARRFVVARGILRDLLSGFTGTPAQKLKFEYGSAGKPSLVDHEINFNNVEVDFVVHQRRLSRAPVLELELLRRRASKSRQKITKDSASYHEAPRKNWRKVIGALALFDRKCAGEIRVARIRHLERRYPHLHFFRHQFK